MPLGLTYRRILEECASVAEAEALLKEVGRTTWMNLAVADSREAVVFEITPEQVGVRPAESGVACCTNHFQLDGLTTIQSCDRIQKLDRLAGNGEKFDVRQVQSALHAVNQGEFTLQTMVFEPKSLRMHVSFGGPGPVSNRQMKTLELREWLTAAEQAVP
ncbi:MAG: carcinine hydrolase/isopenicillin-N N-acyltransferase family protein [Planctomycetaceae bacterium]